jgi:anti-sigma regulatory factor (Ser/Thr protein kinase)
MPAPPEPRTAGAQPSPGPSRPAAARSPRVSLDLGALLTAPGCARAWTRQILWEWGLTELSDMTEIVVSELVTNSVNASRGPDRPVIRLILTSAQGELAVLVCDNHPGAPQALHPGADDESGRGLLLVQTLSARSGWYPLEDGAPGKVTWAIMQAGKAG